MTQSEVEAFFVREFESLLPGYRSRQAGDCDLLSMTKAALLQAVQIVEELPRSHWVWQPGYAVQTVNRHRIRDFCSFRLREDPTDELASWIRIGLSLEGGDPSFGQADFERLRSRAGFNASWPVYAACFCQRVWSSSQSVWLGPYLRRAGLLPAASATVLAIREQRDPYIDVFETEEFTREFAAECLEIALADGFETPAGESSREW